jgi:hypothetical protein
MKNKFTNEQKILMQSVKELHNLTVDTCGMWGSSYEENLDGAVTYCTLNGEHFKITVEKV